MEDAMLADLVGEDARRDQPVDWQRVSRYFYGRSEREIRSRFARIASESPSADDVWTFEDDLELVRARLARGPLWSTFARTLPFSEPKTGRSCCQRFQRLERRLNGARTDTQVQAALRLAYAKRSRKSVERAPRRSPGLFNPAGFDGVSSDLDAHAGLFQRCHGGECLELVAAPRVDAEDLDRSMREAAASIDFDDFLLATPPPDAPRPPALPCSGSDDTESLYSGGGGSTGGRSRVSTESSLGYGTSSASSKSEGASSACWSLPSSAGGLPTPPVLQAWGGAAEKFIHPALLARADAAAPEAAPKKRAGKPPQGQPPADDRHRVAPPPSVSNKISDTLHWLLSGPTQPAGAASIPCSGVAAHNPLLGRLDAALARAPKLLASAAEKSAFSDPLRRAPRRSLTDNAWMSALEPYKCVAKTMLGVNENSTLSSFLSHRWCPWALWMDRTTRSQQPTVPSELRLPSTLWQFCSFKFNLQLPFCRVSAM
ncbi:hypothetical protein DIPPA_10499 [Diplonema papillatum]|nr:hypothetical protein DIPPA_10499 [Diplonema papillatum]